MHRNNAPQFASSSSEERFQPSESNAQRVAIPGTYNRPALLSILFRETDRVQRMKTALCLILFGIDTDENSDSSMDAWCCDEVLSQVARRTTRLLRSYDLLGQLENHEFLLVLPGCDNFNATMLAERLRIDVFSQPFQFPGKQIQLAACFGIASSNGRSPVIVLREAEKALCSAKHQGPGSIHCFGECFEATADTTAFFDTEYKSHAW
jgi:two-component system cell cycle response regulator